MTSTTRRRPSTAASALLGVLLLTLLATTAVRAQTDPAEEVRLAKFKAVFVYNFIDYVKWPVFRQTGPFVIGVVGPSHALPFLEQIAHKRKAGDRDIEVRQRQAGARLDSCHILLLDPSAEDHLGEIQTRLKGKHVLTVGDGLGGRGLAINFVLVDGKLKFEIDPKALARDGLNMSSQLLKLGILVE